MRLWFNSIATYKKPDLQHLLASVDIQNEMHSHWIILPCSIRQSASAGQLNFSSSRLDKPLSYWSGAEITPLVKQSSKWLQSKCYVVDFDWVFFSTERCGNAPHPLLPCFGWTRVHQGWFLVSACGNNLLLQVCIGMWRTCDCHTESQRHLYITSFAPIFNLYFGDA